MFLKLSEPFSAGQYDTTRLSERASCGPLEHFYSHLQIVENFQFWEAYLEPLGVFKLSKPCTQIQKKVFIKIS